MSNSSFDAIFIKELCAVKIVWENGENLGEPEIIYHFDDDVDAIPWANWVNQNKKHLFIIFNEFCC